MNEVKGFNSLIKSTYFFFGLFPFNNGIVKSTTFVLIGTWASNGFSDCLRHESLHCTWSLGLMPYLGKFHVKKGGKYQNWYKVLY